jgi:type I restriction enzyme S subunit
LELNGKNKMLKFRWEIEFKEIEFGEIPRGWGVKKLGNLATIKTGKTDVKDAVENGKYPLFDRSEKVKRSNKYLFDTEAVIVPGEGKDFMPRYYNGKFDLHQRTYAIFNFDNLNGKYLFFAMHILKQYLVDTAVGSTVNSLRLPIFQNLQIPYPPPPEQSRIATVLSWFDDLIENKKKQNEILEKTAMAIFKSWFIDFEPFKNEEFVESELGEIPKGWEVSDLKEVVKSQYGLTTSSEHTGEIKLLRITDINKTFVVDWDSVPCCNISEEEFSKYKLNDKDIVISRIADIGKVAIVEEPPKSVFASYLIRLKIKPNILITPYYLYYWLKSPIYQEYIEGVGEGSTRQNTNAEVIKAGPILIPDDESLKKFEELAEDIRQKIILNQKQIMVLRKIRNTLLPLLVFGKLRVEEI